MRTIVRHFGRIEGSLLQSFCKNAEAASVPEQNPDVVASLVEKDEEMSLERILVKNMPNGRDKPVKAFAHVDRFSACKYSRGRRQCQHERLSKTFRIAFS